MANMQNFDAFLTQHTAEAADTSPPESHQWAALPPQAAPAPAPARSVPEPAQPVHTPSPFASLVTGMPAGSPRQPQQSAPLSSHADQPLSRANEQMAERESLVTESLVRQDSDDYGLPEGLRESNVSGALMQLATECRVACGQLVDNTVPRAKQWKESVVDRMTEQGWFVPVASPFVLAVCGSLFAVAFAYLMIQINQC
eukprot:TRINITY_DN14745_c0_g1_i4.p1 TRINITY_DN14745_c0_g1~~TRINITY_DN14745_c0_g1_i4.p1  ORF type:complete len:199 (+),score=15.26 TRINITY_DN14745_c0_g1_i4:239-835(+)